jgi:IS30 family transposase
MPTADYDAGCRARSDKLSDQEIQDIVITANLTPRKCLGFKTPFQAILKELGKDVQIRFT